MPAPQYIPLEFQPGLWKNGTLYQARGRWFDSDLMRWSVGGLGPVGGWTPWGFGTYPARSDVDGDDDTGPPRTALTWMDNRFRRWMVTGSAGKLYVYDDAASLFDITPSGFTTGRINADPNTGYGNSSYGHSSYGDSRPDLGTPIPADIFVVLGGMLTSDGPLNLALLFLVVWIGNVAGAMTVYKLGYIYGFSFFEEGRGRRLLSSKQKVELGAFYHKKGMLAIFCARFMPGFRVAVPVFAGVVRVDFLKVSIAIGSASAIWYSLLLYTPASTGQTPPLENAPIPLQDPALSVRLHYQ